MKQKNRVYISGQLADHYFWMMLIVEMSLEKNEQMHSDWWFCWSKLQLSPSQTAIFLFWIHNIYSWLAVLFMQLTTRTVACIHVNFNFNYIHTRLTLPWFTVLIIFNFIHQTKWCACRKFIEAKSQRLQ